MLLPGEMGPKRLRLLSCRCVGMRSLVAFEPRSDGRAGRQKCLTTIRISFAIGTGFLSKDGKAR
jgi:hypothetical protein